MNFIAFDRRIKNDYPRLHPWLWFIGLWLTGFLSLGIVAYGLRWLIKG